MPPSNRHRGCRVRILIGVFCVVLSGAAAAAGYTSTASTVRLGSKVISAGDSSARVADAGGQPSEKANIVNEYGKKIGERWTYTNRSGKRTIVEFSDEGIVTGVMEVIGQ